MKKLLSCVVLSVMLVAVVAMSASALTWGTGSGLWVHEGASYGDAVATKLSPVILSNATANSVTVEQGGYWKAPYTNGGVWTKEAVGLDGLCVEVYFEKVPVATNDCWFALHLLDKPTLFTTNGDTLGYKNLIRFADPKLEYYLPAFGSTGSSEVGANDCIFALVSGDTLTMNVEYEFGQYIVSYIHTTGNRTRTFTVPADKTLDASAEVFNKSGKAYISLCGALLGSESDWKYTVTVYEGTGLSQKEIAAQAFEQSKGTIKADIEAYSKHVFESVENVDYYLDGLYYEDDLTVLDALETLENAVEDVERAEEMLINAIDEAEVQEARSLAEKACKDAQSAEITVESISEFLLTVEEAEAETPKADDSSEVYAQFESGVAVKKPSKHSYGKNYVNYDYDDDDDDDDDYSDDTTESLIDKIAGAGAVVIIVAIILALVSFLLPIALIVIIIVLVVKNNKKKKALLQQQYQNYNNNIQQ